MSSEEGNSRHDAEDEDDPSVSPRGPQRMDDQSSYASGEFDGEEDDERPWRKVDCPKSWLAMVVVPGPCEDGMERKIWTCVVEEGDDVKLDGNWDETATGTFAAARRDDWAICTYLAARCFATHGKESLAVPIDSALAAVWVWAVCPIVVDIPRGHERLWLRVEGSSQAIWTERGVSVFEEWFREEGLRCTELPHADCAVTDQQKHLMMQAGQWNEKKLNDEQHIIQAEWVSTDRITMVGGGQLRVHANGAWTPAFSPGGTRCSAEHFSVGKVLELSQLKWSYRHVKCLSLREEDQVMLRGFVSGSEHDSKESAFLTQDVRLGHVRGGCFQVLAYPLSGDFTKALLRPVEGVWSARQKAVAAEMKRSFGDRVITTFAKANKWSLVLLLLENGVEFPKMDEEFADVCGGNAAVRRLWMRDLAKASGNQGQSLFEMAFNAPDIEIAGTKQSVLRRMLEILIDSKQLPDLNRCCFGHSSLLVAAAAASPRRWDIVKLLLELGEEAVSATPLINSLVFAEAPKACQELVVLHGASGSRAQTLKEYFERQAAGEVMTPELLPVSWTLDDDGFITSAYQVVSQDMKATEVARELPVVLETCAWLGAPSLDHGCRLAFVSISESNEDLEHCLKQVRQALLEGSRILPINMCQEDRRAIVQDPKEPGIWLALLCTASFLCKDALGKLFLRLPQNFIPNPMIPQANARICVITPCCEKEVKNVLVHINGKPAGITGEDGSLRLALPIGEHRVSLPHHSSEHKAITVASAIQNEHEVTLRMNGSMFLFLQDMFGKTAVKVTTNKFKILKEDGVLPFVGKAWLDGSNRTHETAKDHVFGAVLHLEHGIKCGEQFPIHVEPHRSCGHSFQPTIEEASFGTWAMSNHESDLCSMAQLAGDSPPFNLGYLTVSNSPSPFAPTPATSFPRFSNAVEDSLDVFIGRRPPRNSGRIMRGECSAKRARSMGGTVRRSNSRRNLRNNSPAICPMRHSGPRPLRRGEVGAALRPFM